MAEQNPQFSTSLSRVNDAYMPLIEKQMAGNAIEFSEYAKRCVMNAIGTIGQMLDKNGLAFNSKDLDQSNLTSILLNVAHLEVNAIAQPAECYFQIRKIKMPDNTYKKQVEMGVQGDGFDRILARFGRNVQKVFPHWLVRENDGFEYPKYSGVEYTPPCWEPKGTGKVVRVVYPILHTDGTIHFYIGERDDVLNNLMAHINNNLMNETFGIAKTRYNASPDQLAAINKRKAELKAKARKLGWDVLDDPEFDDFISPSWKEEYSRESMIIRKMRNNVVKKIPKDFGAPAVMESYSVATTDSDGYANITNPRQMIEGRTEIIDVEAFDVHEGDSTAQPVGNPAAYAGENPAAPAAQTASEGGRKKPSFG